jgi:HlyD family secretion protein
VTEIANSARGQSGFSGGGSSQEATKFEVRIRVKEKEAFRPGMSVTAEIETRSRTNSLTVPIASVTTRLPKPPEKGKEASATNAVAAKTNPPAAQAAAATNTAGSNGVSVASADGTNSAAKKSKEAVKPIEVVFVLDGERVKMVPVKIGICDDSYWEVTEGLKEGQEVVSGGYRAISRDLEDGKKVRKGVVGADKEGGKSERKEG